MSSEDRATYPLLAAAGLGWQRHTPRARNNGIGEEWLVCVADGQVWPCGIVQAYRAGRQDAASDVEAKAKVTDPFPITPPTPAERAQVAEGVALLTAAADRLERLSDDATRLPWSIHQEYGWIGSVKSWVVTERLQEEDADLIVSLVNAAPELVALLCDAAREAGEVGANPWAVALARKIMGEER